MAKRRRQAKPSVATSTPPVAEKRRVFAFLTKSGFWSSTTNIILAGVGIWGVYQTSRALELNERAWITTTGTRMIATPRIGQGITFGVQYINSGKEPALAVTWAFQSGVLPAPLGLDGSTPLIPTNTTCEGLTPTAENIAPPSSVNPGTQYHNTAQDTPPVLADQDFLEGITQVYVLGCIAYKTFEAVHHSGWCMIYRMTPPALRPPEIASDEDSKRDLANGRMAYPCNSGFSAD